MNWLFCIGICMDGLAVMTGWLSGFTTWVKEVVSECELMKSVIHREILASWKVSTEFNNVLQNVIKIINDMSLTQVFSCSEERNTKHICLLLYRRGRWFSKGRSKARAFELPGDSRFLLEKQLPLAAHFSNTELVTKLLAYSVSQWTQSVCSGKNSNCVSQQIKRLLSKLNWKYGGKYWNLEFLTCFNKH